MQSSHSHSQNGSGGVYPSGLPFQGMNVLLPVHMNGMNVSASRGVNLSMPVNMNMNMSMGMGMGMTYANVPAQIHSQPAAAVNMFYHPHSHPHAHPHTVPSHAHGSLGMSHSHSQGHALPLGSPMLHAAPAAATSDEEEKEKQSKTGNRLARTAQGNGVVSDGHTRGPQQSPLQAFLPAKVVALATPALSTVLSAPATPSAVSGSNNAYVASSLAGGTSTSASNSSASAVSSSLPSSLPATMEALEEYYYQLLSPFLSHFRRADSALVWLCRASPSSSFSLAVPRIFRNPKSSGGEGGYADAFKKLGLSLREKERRSGHFHLWYCDFRTVNLAALQTALKKRWTESDACNDRELDELMAQANTKNKKEQREEVEEPMQERKERKDKEKPKDSELEKDHAEEKSSFIDLSTIQSHVNAARSHNTNSALNIHAKRLSVQQHLARKHKEKTKDTGSLSAMNGSNHSSAAKPSVAGSAQVALPVSVPVLEMGMNIGGGMEEYYPNGLQSAHGYVGAVSANGKEFSASSGKEWNYEKEFDSDADSAAKAMDCAYYFQASAAPGYPPNAFYPQANYYVYHPAAHAPQMHSLPHSANSHGIHPALSLASNGSAALHGGYGDVPISVLGNFASPPVFHRPGAAGNYFRGGSVPAFVEYEDERRLKRSYEANSKMEEMGQAPLKKLTTPSSSLPTPPGNTLRRVGSPAPAQLASANNPIKSLLTSSSTHALKLTAAAQNQGNAAQLGLTAMHKEADPSAVAAEKGGAAAADGDGADSAMDEDTRSTADAEIVGHLLQLKTLPNGVDGSTKAFFSKPAVCAAPQAQSQAEMMSG